MNFHVDRSRVDELSGLATPDWVHGVWQRTRRRAGAGENRTDTVIWIQTPTLYADIRVPAPGDVSSRAKTGGFAGWLDVEDQICRWQRPIDLDPGPEGADQGVMFRDEASMIEVGLLANYLEDYRLIDPATRSFAASRGGFTVHNGSVGFAREGPLDIVVAAGPYLTHARRDGSSSLRHGSFDASDRRASFDLSVGDPAVFSAGSGDWTVWTDDLAESEGDALLATLSGPTQ